MEKVKAIKVTNKSGFNGKIMIDYQEVTLESGVIVACIDNKLIPSEEVVKFMNMSNSIYSFTCICNRRGTEIEFPETLHIPKRRK